MLDVVVMVVVDVARDAASRSQQLFRDFSAARTLESALMILDLPPSTSQSCSVSGMPPGISSSSDTRRMAEKEKPLKKNEKKTIVRDL